MSRRKSFANQKRTGLDARYNSELIFKLINQIMYSGKKTIAERVVYEAMEIVEEEISENSLSVVQAVFENIRPLIEVRTKRIGGANYQIPTDVRTERSFSLARRWLVISARERKEIILKKSKKTGQKYLIMSCRLANELLAAYKNEGLAYKKKENMMKMVESNRAFSHLKF